MSLIVKAAPEPGGGVGPISAAVLRRFCIRLLVAGGSKPRDAVIVAESLIDAELDGISSHGVSRLPFYLKRLSQGYINRRPNLRVTVEAGAASVLDADNAFGAVAAHHAMQLAISRARTFSIGLCAVKNSNHLGALSFYVRQAARRGYIGLACCNSAPAIAPPGAKDAVLGTNPLAAGFPNGSQPLIVDMSTSQINRSLIIEAAASGARLEPGWALDESGQPTLDAKAATKGSLLPIGGAKGFGLSLIVEVLSAVISGASISPRITGTFTDSNRVSGVGHLMLCINPLVLNPGFGADIVDLIQVLRASSPASAGTLVRLPGDRRQRSRAESQESGIFIRLSAAAALKSVAAGYHVTLPWAVAGGA